MKKQTKIENAPNADNGGRRSGGERRSFSYTYYIPERRKGQDRRQGKERRMSHRPKIGPKVLTPQRDDQLDQPGIPS